MRSYSASGFVGVWFVVLLAAAPCALAQDILVTRFDDPVPNGCTPADCSLREAVIEANVDPTIPNDIRLAAGTYQVNATPLAVTGGARFEGAGSTQTLIRGDGITDLMTFDSNMQLGISSLALDALGKRELFAANGNAVRLYRVRAPNPLGSIRVEPAAGGGGSGGSFSIGESEIVAPIAGVNKASFTLFESRVARVSVFGSNMFNIGFTEIWLFDSVIDGTLAPGSASGAYLSTVDSVRIVRTDMLDTSEGLRILGNPLGGIGELTIDRLRYVGNARPLEIDYMAGTLSRSEFLDNINGDLADPQPGALRVSYTTDLLVTGSTFAGNRGSASAGGALLASGFDISLTIENSTFSNNSIAVAAAALPGGARGGAIGWNSDLVDSTLILRHVTVAAAVTQPVGLTGSAIGGFGVADDVSLRVYNSILRGSCRFATGAIDFGIGNIESTGNTCGLSTELNTVGVSSTALALGALADHGGLTLTYQPAANSVAIDGADALFCPDVDQRGYVRPLGAGCDIGAVEAGDVIFADGFD